MVELVKMIIAWIYAVLGITGRRFRRTYSDPNVIRIVNYHRTPANELKTFAKQLRWYRKVFVNIDYEQFEKFMNGELTLEKPGVILTFDDGLLNNYEQALPLLERYGFTGWFMVSAGNADGVEYMTYENMQDLLRRGHVIGCHTFTHHRMDEADTEEILEKEITEAGMLLEDMLGKKTDIFCWCGGEENTYTAKAEEKIEQSYKYGFMTNSDLVHPDTDRYHLQRTNVEARWPLSLAQFQLAGFMDDMYKEKRERVNALTAREAE